MKEKTMPFDHNQTTYQMHVTFGPVETDHHNTHIKAYVNDALVGRVKIRKERLVFRCPNQPGTNNVRTPTFNPSAYTLEELIMKRDVLKDLIPIVIRNYLNHRRYLADVLPT